MEITNEQVNNYINDTLEMFDGEVGELQAESYKEDYPIVGKATAKFLSTLIRAIKPAEILEIGCCIGFSSILMASLTDPRCHITTIDRYPIMIREAKANFKKFGLEDKITLLEGDAGKILPDMDRKFDFIFLDAAKGQYLHFLPHCIRMLNTGGVLLADDAMQNGYVAMDRYSVPRRHRTTHRRMREFIYAVTHARGLESCIIPCDNGLVMCTKTSDKVEINISGFDY